MEVIFGETIITTYVKCNTTLQEIIDKEEGNYFYCPTCNNCQMSGTATEQMLTQCDKCKRDHDSVLCPFCTKEQEFDFILVRQKDYIISLIDNRRLVEARCCLRTVSELWKENNYEYKLNELAERIRSSPRRKEED